MHAITVTLTIRPGRMAEFLPLMAGNARVSRATEPGCLQFDICTGGAEDRVFLYELYDSEAAFAAHLQSAHFKAFDAAVADMVAEKEIRAFSEVIR